VSVACVFEKLTVNFPSILFATYHEPSTGPLKVTNILLEVCASGLMISTVVVPVASTAFPADEEPSVAVVAMNSCAASCWNCAKPFSIVTPRLASAVSMLELEKKPTLVEVAVEFWEA
jgi:hypothetical protein